jgi:hypothetical protein
MMRRFVKSVCAAALGLSACAAVLALSDEASAQEIQLTGPLAGAPAVRKLRLHRAGRFEVAPGASFTLLDQYLRSIIVGGTLTYHPTDWIGVGVWGGYGFQYSTGLTDELQEKAIDQRQCASRPFTQACKLTAVNLTRGKLSTDQLGHIQWVVAPQVSVVPFRGKLSLFSSVFFDTDVNIFAGPAIIGMQERAPCGKTDDGKAATPCSNQSSFQLQNRIAFAPTFGLGLNFYFLSFMNLGVDWRALPFSWNTAGFDNHGGGTNKDFPDNNVNGSDREFHFTSMLTVRLGFQFPTAIKTSE